MMVRSLNQAEGSQGRGPGGGSQWSQAGPSHGLSPGWWAGPGPGLGLASVLGPPPPRCTSWAPGGGDYLLILYFDYLPRCRPAAAVRTELCPTLNYLWSFRLLTRLLLGSNHILSCKQVHSSLTMTCPRLNLVILIGFLSEIVIFVHPKKTFLNVLRTKNK